ncbi:MAG TPA: hydroxymethylbilane synthase [Patescibacteria group bacterium]|nr:hydroxymethylbilane synthase [Patescibacteria group bacterium]
MKNIIIGSRGSKLALIQSEYVRGLLKNANSDLNFDIKIIATTGDKILNVPLAQIGDKALFTKELEMAMLAGEIDMAVHSLKDLPTRLPKGLQLGAVCEREDVCDVFLKHPDSPFKSIAELPQGAKIASGSLRRKSQLLHKRPDLEIHDIRGNLDTRFKKLYESDLAGMILAHAGILRMGYQNRISEVISTEAILPAVSQGAIGIEIRENDENILKLLKTINHTETELATRAERAMLRKLEGGCQVPIGAYARVVGEEIQLEGVICSLDGKKLVRDFLSDSTKSPEELGTALAEMLLSKGGDEILKELRNI